LLQTAFLRLGGHGTSRACIASPIDRNLPKLQPSGLGYVAERFPVPSRPDDRSRVALYRTEVDAGHRFERNQPALPEMEPNSIRSFKVQKFMAAQIKNLLAAFDGSEPAGRALDVAVAIAKAVGGTLSIMTVGDILTRKEQEAFRRAEGGMADPSEVFAKRLLAQACDRSEGAGVRVQALLRWGDPAEAIIEAISQDKFDVVVVGRRGRGRLSGLLLGSVSQKLVSLAPSVVIVVP